MIGCLRTRAHKQPIIALSFEFENEFKFYNLEACPHISMSVCRLILRHMHLCIRIIDHVSVCGVLISPGSMSTVVSKKKIHYSFEGRIEKSVPRHHRLSSLGKPRDAKRRSSGRIFLSYPHTHDIFL